MAAPFDAPRLESYIKEKLGLSGELIIQPISGGQSNPTFFVDVGQRRLVLRKRPPGVLLPSAHAIDREFRVQEALAGSDVPVARMLHYCDDTAIIGTAFYLMDRIDGRIFPDSAMSSAPHGERREMYRSAARILAAIHDFDLERSKLGDFGRHGGYMARQLKRWSGQWRLADGENNAEMERLVAWLEQNMPGDEETSLTHGDFRIGNLIYHPVEPRVVAVLDWELSTLGDPLADLAHSCVYAWHVRPEEYGGLLGIDLAGSGLPDLNDYVADYRSASGRDRRLMDYHLVFALFRNAAIFQGIAARARQGNASSDNAASVGGLAPILLRRGVELAGV